MQVFKSVIFLQGQKQNKEDIERGSVIVQLAKELNLGIAILALLFFLATIVMPCLLRGTKKKPSLVQEPNPAPERATRPATRVEPAMPNDELGSPEHAPVLQEEALGSPEPEPAMQEEALGLPAAGAAPGSPKTTLRPPRPPSPQPAPPPREEECMPEPYQEIQIYSTPLEPEPKSEEDQDWKDYASDLLKEINWLRMQRARQLEPDFNTPMTGSWSFHRFTPSPPRAAVEWKERPMLMQPSLPPPPPPPIVRNPSLPLQRRVKFGDQEELPSWTRRRDHSPAWSRAEDELPTFSRDQRPPWAQARDRARGRTQDLAETQV